MVRVAFASPKTLDVNTIRLARLRELLTASWRCAKPASKRSMSSYKNEVTRIDRRRVAERQDIVRTL
jgi:hypothetical protein